MPSPSIISQSLPPLFTYLGEPAFCHHLLKMIRTQVSCDSMLMLLYRKGERPGIILDEMSKKDRLALRQSYFNGAYLLSPYYLHWLDQPQTALLHLADITPEGFFDSVYYTDYFAFSGLTDELAYLIPLETDSAILLCVGRMDQSARFSTADIALLQELQALITASLQRHFSLHTLPPRQLMKNWLEDGLRLFGSSVLTEREQQVVQMMLKGYSSKSCARVLTISPSTERVHRRNIYAKLAITSQAELFSLFFNAMSQKSLRAGEDPFQPPDS